MKVGMFCPRNPLAGQFANGGYRRTFEAMGHEVIDCALPGNVVQNVEQVKEKAPSLAALAEADVIVSFYHEYTQPWIQAIYGWEAWEKLVPKVLARFDESMCRNDLGLPTRVPELLKWAGKWSFPAYQDAKKWGGDWTPFYSDTEVFHLTGGAEDSIKLEKKYDVAFIGSMYPIRQQYLMGLGKVAAGVNFHLPMGFLGVHDLSGLREPETTNLLVENYRQVKIFFVLPPMSRLICAKVADVMACGTFVMYPKLQGDMAGNMTQFEDGREIVYYDPGYFKQNAKLIAKYLVDEYAREAIARAGCERVHREYRLDQMLEKLLGLVAEPKAAAVEVAG